MTTTGEHRVWYAVNVEPRPSRFKEPGAYAAWAARADAHRAPIAAGDRVVFSGDTCEVIAASPARRCEITGEVVQALELRGPYCTHWVVSTHSELETGADALERAALREAATVARVARHRLEVAGA